MTEYSGDIAIIGMAGLYPQADDIDVFWENILAKKNAVTEAEPDWLGASDIFDPASSHIEEIYTNRGGFLGDLSRFDAREFGTMPFSVEGGQPDQFIALKLCRDALADGGYAAGEADHESTGVILGHSVHAHRANANGVQQIWFHSQARNLFRSLFPDLPDARVAEAVKLLQQKMPRITPEAVPGLVPNVMTGRIANRLDLMGPNYIIDAACSSSLIATELAAEELRAGRAKMMLAGGVNTTTSPLVYSVFCSVGALSRGGQIRPFDAAADGTVLGEGAGAILLKRLEDALADGDRVYAVIKGVGQSSDGKSSGLMAPRLEGEVLAMRRAYAQTGIDPASIGHVEAHGTGIPLGDRTEMTALQEIFGSRQGDIPLIPIGSLKSMIGHCIPAAGSASIIKSALALTHKIVPPTLCDEVSSDIGISETPFYVSTEARPWIHSGSDPRRAAINAFGFGGINAHMIIEESPQTRFPDATAAFLPVTDASAYAEDVFVATAETPATLLARATALIEALGAVSDPVGFAELARQSWDEAGTEAARFAIIAADPADLAKKLSSTAAHLEKRPDAPLQTRNGIYFEPKPIEGKVAFLFPGEMAQYPGMMADALKAFPEMRSWFDFISALSGTEREVRLQDVAFPPPTELTAEAAARLENLLHQVDYGSEIVFAADQAVDGMLRQLGVQPEAMLGHSTGENAAIVASGWFPMSRDEIGTMIARMNEVFNAVNRSGAVPQGVLLTIASLSREEFDKALAGRDGLHFTMDNCPNQFIVFGQKDQVDALEADVVSLGAVCTRLPISWGYHTEYVRPMADGFGALFADMKMKANDVALYSCATAKPFPRDRNAFQDTAIDQYVSCVRFREAVEQLYEDGFRYFVECGPNATLTAFVRDTLAGKRAIIASADNRRKGMIHQLRNVVAQFFAAGHAVPRPEILQPRESADQERRRALREQHRASPPLTSTLPFPELEEEEVEQFRSLLGLADAPAEQASPASAAVAPQPAMAAPQAAATSPEPVVAEGPAAIGYFDLAPFFPLPFAYSAYLMTGAPGAGLFAHLSLEEQQQAQQHIAEGWSEDRFTHWALGRLALKQAARVMWAGQQLQLSDPEIAVRATEAGAPQVVAPQFGLQIDAASIAHVGGVAVAAAAEAPWRIGVDYELPARIRDPEQFLASILSPGEAQSLRITPEQRTAALIWSMKEAASKAVGTGLQGRPDLFELIEVGDGGASGRVRYGDTVIETCSRPVGDGICSFGYLVPV